MTKEEENEICDWTIHVKSLFQNAGLEPPAGDELMDWYASGCSPHDVIDNLKQ